ncbi:MAG: DUF1015 domain-containing protein, partial [Bacilli bacterium]|nr:DUF1015 domain-containing protein [Bacilli bacterium]
MKVIRPCNILIPNPYADIRKWAVIACDQYTSEEKYWKDLSEYVDNEPSALNLIFPEVYLNKIDNQKKIKDINNNMDKLLKANFFSEYKKSYVFVERETSTGIRLGLVGAIDLEAYDFSRDDTLIRASEKTVKERLPIRVKIRENAALELSHIVLLIDDQKKTLLEELAKRKYSFKRLYDFDLNMNGGNIRAYLINDDKTIKEIEEKFDNLIDDNLLALVGDGNHSLASAKMHYENLKAKLSKEKAENNMARYAMVEVENIYDDAMQFDAIHRVVYNAGDDFVEGLKETIKGDLKTKIIIGDKEEDLYVNSNAIVAVKEVQEYIDDYIDKHNDVSLD